MKLLSRVGPPRRWLARVAPPGFLDHTVILMLYGLLSVGLTWPLAAGFATSVSMGGDTAHNVWRIWQVREVLLGRAALFEAPLLYYPRGISLLIHGVGPLSGLFGLPFWGWGAVAAYNGALLVSLALSGYCMDLLARDLGFSRPVAFFAGVVFLSSPLHLAGRTGHIEKLFIGLLPLTLLCLRRAGDRRRGPGWCLATAGCLLATALHSGYQFIYAGLIVALFGAAAFWSAPRGERRWLLGRAALLAVCCAVLVGPLLAAIMAASGDPAYEVAANTQSFAFQPDALQLLLPPSNNRAFGWATQRIMEPYRSGLLFPNLETEVSIPALALLLCAVAGWHWRPRRRIAGSRPAGRPWPFLALLALAAVLALGPRLRLAGRTGFTAYDLPIALPYALLTSLPGLTFMRVSGRFMMMGALGFSIGASYGLAALSEHWPRWRVPALLAALAGVLLTTWPQPLRVEPLPPAPPFYQELARDPAEYGVFDLPLPWSGDGWPHQTALQQVYQMTHRKGIYGGYLSRVYRTHPLFPALMAGETEQPDITLNGAPTSVYDTMHRRLADLNYRYVVRHLGQPPANDRDGRFAAQERASQELIERVFGATPPVFADDATLVYAIAPPPATAFSIGTNWRGREGDWRWATSPATLVAVTPDDRPRAATLRLVPYSVHDPAAPNGVGQRGVLNVRVGSGPVISVPIVAGELAVIPLTLPGGSQEITLSLAAGNFRPSDYGEADPAWLSFAVRSIDLEVEP